MTPEQRKAALILARVKQTTIARRCRVSRATVSRVVDGSAQNPKVRRAVAKAIGRPVDEVFPPRDLPQAA